jgi:hypothetical protein
MPTQEYSPPGHRDRFNTGKDFVNSKSIRRTCNTGDDVAFDVELGYPAKARFRHFA